MKQPDNCPEISVIIPVYNLENYLVPCLESVVAQSYRDFEAIVVNDGSRDAPRVPLRSRSPRRIRASV